MNIEEKAKLAHEWFMGMVSAKAPATVTTAWRYADAMEAEYNKRKQAKAEKDAEDAKVFFDKLIVADSPQLDFQVDWSVSPQSANYWAMDENTCCNWYGKEPDVVGDQWDFGNVLKFAPPFDYKGDWKDSLRKRP